MARDLRGELDVRDRAGRCSSTAACVLDRAKPDGRPEAPAQPPRAALLAAHERAGASARQFARVFSAEHPLTRRGGRRPVVADRPQRRRTHRPPAGPLHRRARSRSPTAGTARSATGPGRCSLAWGTAGPGRDDGRCSTACVELRPRRPGRPSCPSSATTRRSRTRRGSPRRSTRRSPSRPPAPDSDDRDPRDRGQRLVVDVAPEARGRGRGSPATGTARRRAPCPRRCRGRATTSWSRPGRSARAARAAGDCASSCPSTRAQRPAAPAAAQRLASHASRWTTSSRVSG